MKDEKIPKGDPIPTRFDAPEDKILRSMRASTGLPKSEIVRRAVKLLIAECKRRKDVKWILTELGPPLEFLSEEADQRDELHIKPSTKLPDSIREKESRAANKTVRKQA